MQAIVPCIWLNGNAEEAINFYIKVFPNSKINSLERYPDESLDSHFKGMSGKIINGSFTLNGMDFICFDGGPEFKLNETVSFTVMCKDQEKIDYYWSKLSHVPESEQCGWCKDKFGLSWQIIPENLDELMSRGPYAVKTLMSQSKIIIAEY